MKHYKEFKKYCKNECIINPEICGGKKEEKDCYTAFIDSKCEQLKNKVKNSEEGMNSIRKLLPSARPDDNDIKWILDQTKEYTGEEK